MKICIEHHKCIICNTHYIYNDNYKSEYITEFICLNSCSRVALDNNLTLHYVISNITYQEILYSLYVSSIEGYLIYLNRLTQPGEWWIKTSISNSNFFHLTKKDIINSIDQYNKIKVLR